MSLARAILEYVNDFIKCKTLFSTHYHELTDLENKYKTIKNVHVDAVEEDGKITFLHKVKPGAVDKSYGIHVGKLAGLPPVVVRRAEQILEKLEAQNTHTTTIVDNLPLFASVMQQEESKTSKAEEMLKTINPDGLTPKQALDALYELKALL